MTTQPSPSEKDQNRVIRFRAWDKINNRMLHFGKFIWHDEYNLCYMDGSLDVPAEDNLIWMQFTGIQDKNGKDVFEGDIVQMWRHDDNTNRHERDTYWKDGGRHLNIKEVKFMFGSFVIWSDFIHDYRCFANLARPGESFEVLGNKWQHPSLLNPQTP
jgi:uncharacterized phage protein (TIGR01671 family)